MQLANLYCSIQRSFTCVCLLGLVVSSAYPLDSRNIAQYAKQFKLSKLILQRAANERSLANVYQRRYGPETAIRDKRYGIVGLDNVDMITSTLDRARKKQKNKPTMSMRLSMDDLRRMLDAGR